MPEIAEIRLMSEHLNMDLKGKICEGIRINSQNRHFKEKKLFSSDFSLKQLGDLDELGFQVKRKCEKIESKGKKIIFDFGDILMIVSCGMEGHFCYEIGNNSGLMIQFEDIFVFFDDSRHMGLFSVVNKNSLAHNNVMKDVGPDWFEESTDYNLFKSIITNTRLKKTRICEFLMQQNRLSGIGNYLRADILYSAKISPHRGLQSLGEFDLQNLFYWAKTIIYESYSKQACTIKSYTDPHGNTGNYVPKCYGRSTDEFGNQVLKFSDKQNRTVHWVPNVQI